MHSSDAPATLKTARAGQALDRQIPRTDTTDPEGDHDPATATTARESIRVRTREDAEIPGAEPVANRVIRRVVTRAIGDPAYRRRLLEDSNAVMGDEFARAGIPVPDTKFDVVEATENRWVKATPSSAVGGTLCPQGCTVNTNCACTISCTVTPDFPTIDQSNLLDESQDSVQKLSDGLDD